jgi:hypothetical protein
VTSDRNSNKISWSVMSLEFIEIIISTGCGCRMLAYDRDNLPSNPKHMISSKKKMLSTSFSFRAFVSIEFFQQEEKYNSSFCTETVSSSRENFLSICRLKMRVNFIHLYIDNVKLYIVWWISTGWSKTSRDGLRFPYIMKNNESY